MMADEEVKPDSNNAASAAIAGSQTTQQQLIFCYTHQDLP